MTKLVAAMGFLALNFYTYHFLAREAVIPERREFASFPLELGDWTCAGIEPMEAAVERNLGVTDYLTCTYRQRESGQLVGVYVGYHATQVREEGGGAGENSIHPPAHCLPGSGWDIIQSETVPLGLPGLPQQPGSAKRLVIAKGELRQLVYYWYQSRGRVISQDWRKVFFVGFDRALRGRTDGSLVRLSIPIARSGDIPQAQAAFDDLVPQLVALLPDYVPE
jgi:EpsI family protein